MRHLWRWVDVTRIVPEFAPPEPAFEGTDRMATRRPRGETKRSDGFDPYAPQRHKRGRKSHLAEAINQNIHDNPGMGWVWVAILIVLIFGSFALGIFK